MQVGQHVLCIADFPLIRRMIRPVKGVVYTIRDIYKLDQYPEYTYILLVELVNDRARTREPGYNSMHFRPLTKLKVEDFTHVWDLDLINNKEKQDV